MSVTEREILDALNKAREPKAKKTYAGIKKVSAKRKLKMDEEREMAKWDAEFYEEIWRSSPHKCVNCGVGLGKVANNIFFHHLLLKSRYPQFRHNPANIALVCLACHSKAHTNIDFAPVIKELTRKAEQECLKWIKDE